MSKNIVLKNLMFTAVRVTPSAPQSTQFSLKSIPQTTLISPGTSLALTVVFRAAAAEDCDGTIEITTPDGPVSIALRARMPRPHLTVSARVDLPHTAVGATATRTITIENPGSQVVTWRLACTAPFSVAPAMGELQPQASCAVVVTFAPTEARVHTGTLTLKSDGGLAGVAPVLHEFVATGRASFTHVLLEGATQTGVRGYAVFSGAVRSCAVWCGLSVMWWGVVGWGGV